VFELAGPTGLGPGLQDLNLIRRFHRAPDSHIVFMRQHPNTESLKVIGSPKVEQLGFWFPKNADSLLIDSYYTLNGFLHYRRKSKYAGYLNCVFADLDHYSMDCKQARSIIEDAIQSGNLIMPSMIAYSGNGTWIYWILRSADDNTRAPKAYDKSMWRQLMNAIRSKILDIHPALNPDENAIDIARITRVPSSLNSSAVNRTVKYLVPIDKRYSDITYTMNEVSQWLGICRPEKNRTKQKRKTTKGKRREQSEANWFRTNKKRLEEFERIYRHRKGFHEGCRSYAVLVHAIILRDGGYSFEDAMTVVMRMASHCSPPFPVDETQKQVKCAYRQAIGWLYNTTIAKYLKITQDEVATLELEQLRPDFERKQHQKSDKIEKRQEALNRILNDNKEAEGLSLRELAELMRSMGFETSKDTVSRDLKALEARKVST
jgi:hypothetical protein